MPNTKFFTGKGDAGESEINGKKISKRNPAVKFLGALDELNSFTGFARAGAKIFLDTGEIEIAKELYQIQEDLFVIQAEVAKRAFGYDKGPELKEEKTKNLELLIAKIDTKLPPLKNFVIPGGSELSARLDLARTVARSAERTSKEYAEAEGVSLSLAVSQYLNRLSSAFFALARYASHILGEKERNPKY